MRSPHEILKKYWGYDSFRPLQEDIIQSVLAGNDTLGLMPTGGGKSITFQVPGMILDGLTLVVTPIISLMKDQVDNLLERRIKACYLYAGLSFSETKKVFEKCRFGKYKFLYVSPERLCSKSFVDQLRLMNLSMIHLLIISYHKYKKIGRKCIATYFNFDAVIFLCSIILLLQVFYTVDSKTQSCLS